MMEDTGRRTSSTRYTLTSTGRSSSASQSARPTIRWEKGSRYSRSISSIVFLVYDPPVRYV